MCIRDSFQWNALGPLTNGSNLLKSYPDLGGASSYLILIGLFIAIILLLVNSTYGRAFKAIRDDEIDVYKRQPLRRHVFFAGTGCLRRGARKLSGDLEAEHQRRCDRDRYAGRDAGCQAAV